MKALSEAALVGTARHADRASAALTSGLPIDELLSGIDAAVAIERRLLLTAALRSTYEHAGRELPSNVEPFPPAPAEDRPTCSRSARALLEDLITTPPLLREALDRLARAGQIVPPALLPALLDTRDDRLATILPHVIGHRGRWLCALSTRGDWLVDGSVDLAEARRLWQEGLHAQRVAVLTEYRRAGSSEARDWLAESWTQEQPEHRAELLGVFAIRATVDDMPFLELALSDRSLPVRSTAARLLASRPDSETARRLVARADALLSYAPPANRNGMWARMKSAGGAAPTGTLAVTPPQSFDASWQKEGIAAKPPKGIGERAHWLAEALALVPPEHWEERFEAPPPELIRAALATEWTHAILLGWSRAATIRRSGPWIAALWGAWHTMRLDDAAATETASRRAMLELLTRHMPSADAEDRVLDAIAHPDPVAAVHLSMLIDAVSAPWGPAFGRDVLRRLEPQLIAGAAHAWTREAWFDLLASVAARLSPDSFPDAIALVQRLAAIDTLAPANAKKVDEFDRTVRLRQRIHEEIPL